MKRTTLFLDEEVERDLHLLAQRRGVSVSALVRESLSHYIARQNRRQKRTWRFIGIGRSGRQDIAEHHEELLFTDLTPHGDKPGQGRRR